MHARRSRAVLGAPAADHDGARVQLSRWFRWVDRVEPLVNDFALLEFLLSDVGLYEKWDLDACWRESTQEEAPDQNVGDITDVNPGGPSAASSGDAAVGADPEPANVGQLHEAADLSKHGERACDQSILRCLSEVPLNRATYTGTANFVQPTC